jgi:hypothetical protein
LTKGRDAILIVRVVEADRPALVRGGEFDVVKLARTAEFMDDVEVRVTIPSLGDGACGHHQEHQTSNDDLPHGAITNTVSD